MLETIKGQQSYFFDTRSNFNHFDINCAKSGFFNFPKFTILGIETVDKKSQYWKESSPVYSIDYGKLMF